MLDEQENTSTPEHTVTITRTDDLDRMIARLVDDGYMRSHPTIMGWYALKPFVIRFGEALLTFAVTEHEVFHKNDLLAYCDTVG